MKKFQDIPMVAILGRPNVGKSTLFNRLVGHKKAIVHETSGITRDRIEDIVEWDNLEFRLCDLAGWEEKIDSPFEVEMKEIVDDTLKQAQLVLFMVDGRDGLIPQDEILAQKVRKLHKSCILVVNKIDHPDMEKYQGEFMGLGFDETIMISAAHSRSINDLLDMIIENLDFPEDDSEEDFAKIIGVALMGRQNVGKSSMFNFLLGDKRSIVSPIPGTTRDSVDAFFEYDGQRFAIVDTAGLKKRAKTTDDVDYFSSVRAKRSLERADIAIMMLDVVDGVNETDQKIAGLIQESNRAVIILANKWDMTEKDTKQNRDAFVAHVHKELHFIRFAPVIFTSGLKGSGVEELVEAINKVHEHYNQRIQTSEINRVIRDAFEHRPPQSYKGREPKIFYGHQVDVAPPTFQFFCNNPRLFHDNYKRYLEKQIRLVFGFDGAPLKIYYKTRKKSTPGPRVSSEEFEVLNPSADIESWGDEEE